MNTLAKIISILALGAVTLPCLLYDAGVVGLDIVKWTALAGTIGWFVATPLWMSRELPVDAQEVEI